MRNQEYYVMDNFLVSIYDFPHKLMPGLMRNICQKAVELLPKEPERILDMATGTASIAIQAKKAFPKADVYGVDLSERMLLKAAKNAEKAKAGIKLSRQNMESTDFANGFFDAVTIGFAMHHVPQQKTMHVLTEAKRVLKNGGKIIAIDMHKPNNFLLKAILMSAITVIEKHSKPFLKQDMAEELKAAGFASVKKATHYKGMLQVVEGVKSDSPV
ncbi:methyltransferase domain-containing protein [Candidatus Woesearchaeota archaeon]|nr:methyltransferase domain-containing protein [Candidatus Woesearchaeota archaeon]